jgi:hypothetical protein
MSLVDKALADPADYEVSHTYLGWTVNEICSEVVEVITSEAAFKLIRRQRPRASHFFSYWLRRHITCRNQARQLRERLSLATVPQEYLHYRTLLRRRSTSAQYAFSCLKHYVI